MNGALKILIIGNGGREHALCRALMTASPAPKLWITPNSLGPSEFAHTFYTADNDVNTIVCAAKNKNFDFVIPGSEQPLVNGLSDRLAVFNIPCCGPSAAAAQLEGSKSFTRNLCKEVGIPSPRFIVVNNERDLINTINNWEGLPVIKADGLASGKGVFLPDTKEDCITIGKELFGGVFGSAGKTLVIEERLEGVEASLFYACNGLQVVALPHARDYKRLYDNDCGPNTGGMGAISPNPHINDELVLWTKQNIVLPTLEALQKRNISYRVFIYVGLMLTKDGPKLLEYNVRLGDPETQVILPRLKSGEFLRLCLAMILDKLENFELRVEPWSTCAVVVAAKGYPSNPRKGDAIYLKDNFTSDDSWVDYTGIDKYGNLLYTSAGRVATIVARGYTPERACSLAYDGVKQIQFSGMQYRKDIGKNILED